MLMLMLFLARSRIGRGLALVRWRKVEPKIGISEDKDEVSFRMLFNTGQKVPFSALNSPPKWKSLDLFLAEL